jgi:hypothetical protein
VEDVRGVALGVAAGALLAVGRFDARFAVAATTAALGVLATVSAVAPPLAVTAVVVFVVLGGQLSRSAMKRSFSV